MDVSGALLFQDIQGESITSLQCSDVSLKEIPHSCTNLRERYAVDGSVRLLVTKNDNIGTSGSQAKWVLISNKVGNRSSNCTYSQVQ